MIDIQERHRPLFDALSAKGVDCRLVRADERLTTILVKEKFHARVPKLMKSLKYKALLHPYSKLYGYRIMYQMKEFQLYVFGDALLEIYFSLPCESLTDKTWIPLDKLINDSIWERQTERDGIPCLDPHSDFIYRLTQCVFSRKAFDEQSRAYFREALPGLDSEDLHEKLRAVFFKFTDPLLALLREGAFDRIVPDYNSFTDY